MARKERQKVVFVAWRDLLFAKGRFALMGTVIILITMLVGLLSGLTAGLGKESTSAITGLSADRLAFSQPAEGKSVSFTDSTVTESMWQQWSSVDGVDRADPLGITTTKAEAGEHSAAISAFGVQQGSALAPESDRIVPGTAVLSTSAADELDVRTGDDFLLGGQRLTVAAIDGDASYSHTPVIFMDLAAWQALTGGSSTGPLSATVIGLTTSGDTTDLAAADTQIGTDTVTTSDAKSAIGSYTSENGSLQLMRAFMFAISALVIGAFFTVWTIQRTGDVAVLKALGASTGYLLRDALGQAVVLLVAGTAIGTALAAGVGALVGGTVPFVLDIGTVALPALVIIILGAMGAGLSINRITSVDPLTALGSAR